MCLKANIATLGYSNFLTQIVEATKFLRFCSIKNTKTIWKFETFLLSQKRIYNEYNTDWFKMPDTLSKIGAFILIKELKD